MKTLSLRTAALAAGVLILLAAIQPAAPDRRPGNPPVISEPAWDSPVTRDLARQACFDCHSNKTDWPVYARVAPASWLLEHDVKRPGGAELLRVATASGDPWLIVAQ
jgi:hypothetical protein